MNIYDYPPEERRKIFEQNLKEIENNNVINSEDMMKHLAIMRKGYYNPEDWGFEK